MAADNGALEVGRVVRSHGLRGEVVVELWTNRLERMAPTSVLMAGERELVVDRARRFNDDTRWLVSFVGVADREGAEALRETVLFAEPVEVPGALWVHRLIGAEVRAQGGVALGRVAAVEANPASDLIVLEDGRLIPLTFVVADGPGWVTVAGPPGLLDP